MSSVQGGCSPAVSGEERGDSYGQGGGFGGCFCEVLVVDFIGLAALGELPDQPEYINQLSSFLWIIYADPGPGGWQGWAHSLLAKGEPLNTSHSVHCTSSFARIAISLAFVCCPVEWLLTIRRQTGMQPGD